MRFDIFYWETNHMALTAMKKAIRKGQDGAWVHGCSLDADSIRSAAALGRCKYSPRRVRAKEAK